MRHFYPPLASRTTTGWPRTLQRLRTVMVGMKAPGLVWCLLLMAAAGTAGSVQGQGIAVPGPVRSVAPPLLTVSEGAKTRAPTVTRQIGGRTYLALFLEGTPNEADLTAKGVIIESRLPAGIMTAEVPLTAFPEV